MGFIVIVAGIIFFIHLSFVFLVWAWRLPSAFAVGVLAIYHVFFAGLLTSFYQAILTDPGVVPPNWGFYMGDETKRRRYCKMCNVWKPDRSHHCSICNRCILNMDHHCPWINNCVGFYNRKFFIQLLMYAYSSLLTVVVISIFEVPPIFVELSHTKQLFSQHLGYFFKCLYIFFACGLSLLLVCTLTNFIKFHLKLVLENYTTIENLEREEDAKSKFDIGRRRNWEQVFGACWWLWWLPWHTQLSRPVGDGVRWRVHYTRVIDEDEEPGDEPQGGHGSSSRSGVSNL